VYLFHFCRDREVLLVHNKLENIAEITQPLRLSSKTLMVERIKIIVYDKVCNKIVVF
jgi:hypothetical protein